MASWKQLLEALREACPSGLWAKGVDLARSGAVTGAEHDAEQWTFRVRTSGRPVAPTVSLFPADAEWECDCGGRFDACEHVAASAFAVTQAAEGPESLFGSDAQRGVIRHELRRAEGGLIVDRFIVDGDAAPRRLERSLVDLVAGPSAELTVSPTHADLDVDRYICSYVRVKPGEPIGLERVAGLLRTLVGVADLRLDGRPVRASSEPLYPRACVTDAAGGGVALVIEADPDVDEIVTPGVLRCGDTLHPFGAQKRFGKAWERLPLRRTFEISCLAELVGDVLPELRRHIAVEIRTDRLPDEQASLWPWIRFDIDMRDGVVDVFPLLVYGDPPTARVDVGRLVHLQGAVPRRDAAAEKQLVLRLRDRLNLVPGRRVCLEGADAARLLSGIERFDDGRHGEAAGGRDTRRARPELVPRLDVSADGADFDLVFEVAVGAVGGRKGASVAADAVVTAWREGIGLVPLGDGGFARVPASWLETHGHLVMDLLSARDQNEGRVPRAGLPILAELCEALEAPPPFELERLRPLLDAAEPAEAAGETAFAEARQLCPEFRGELRPYQAVGVVWLARLRDAGLGAVLADDMGLGKTIQALCVLKGRALVVCPRSVIHNWTREIERFRPGLSINLYHGPKRTTAPADVTLTTYATMRNDIEALCDVQWEIVVLDEAQAIKNPDSQVARAAFRLPAAFRLSLSGTPIENRPAEMWSQMHFCNRGLLGGRRDFTDRYEGPMLAGDPSVTERLRRRIRPFLLRRLKRDVARDLPPRTDSVLHVELDVEERAAYESVRAATRADIVKRLAGGTGVLAALEALLRLRQAACHRGLLPGTEARTSSKVQALCEALEDAAADGHKALVFSQWTGLLDRVEPHLEALDLAYIRLDGSTRDRQGVVDSFQSDDGPPVMLVSLTAGGTGLNLTAADHVFLLDPWWNPAVEDQAADRAHRIGQERPVMVYRLVAKDTVEERVLDLQARKRRIAEGVLGTDAASGAGGVTREDLLALLD